MWAVELVKLTSLMALSRGRPEVRIGLIDGPVETSHPQLTQGCLRDIPGAGSGTCILTQSAACLHGTFVAGILCAKRDSTAPAICPGCTLLIRSIFLETAGGSDPMPSATPAELAAAIIECVEAGARVINLSLGVSTPSSRGLNELEDAFDYAVKRGVLVVAAAGNQGAMTSSVITRHPWVISVAACDVGGVPSKDSNLSRSVGRYGLRAPGVGVTSLGPEGQSITLGGSSVAAPFVTGTIALLCSEFPNASAAQIRRAIGYAAVSRRASVVPALLDASAAYRYLLTGRERS